MAWSVNGQNLTMVEGDYGLALPITINGVTFAVNDSVLLSFKDKMNGTLILEKSFSGITQNTISFEFTENESAKFPVGVYVYSLDWYQDGEFLCNIVPFAQFKVVDKA